MRRPGPPDSHLPWSPSLATGAPLPLRPPTDASDPERLPPFPTTREPHLQPALRWAPPAARCWGLDSHGITWGGRAEGGRWVGDTHAHVKHPPPHHSRGASESGIWGRGARLAPHPFKALSLTADRQIGTTETLACGRRGAGVFAKERPPPHLRIRGSRLGVFQRGGKERGVRSPRAYGAMRLSNTWKGRDGLPCTPSPALSLHSDSTPVCSFGEPAPVRDACH